MGIHLERALTSEPPDIENSARMADRRWGVLTVLFFVYLTSSVDRLIVSIAGEPIKNEFGLTDWQLGVLNGLAFSLLYAGLGLPLARLADRGNRVTIITVCLAIWSGMTALCGLALNFTQLVLCRLGVGVGEAGCLPASHSLISDYFPRSQRTTALAIFGIGLPLGGMIAMGAGGMIIDWFGWRRAFVLLGLPGLLLVLVTRLLIQEPPGSGDETRGHAVGSAHGGAYEDTLLHTLLFLARSAAARNILIGMTLATFFSSPASSFIAPYMARSFGLSYLHIGLILGIALMGGIALSTFLGGIIADWLGRWDERWYLWVPAASLLLGSPLFALAFAQTVWQAFIGLLVLAALGSVLNKVACWRDR